MLVGDWLSWGFRLWLSRRDEAAQGDSWLYPLYMDRAFVREVMVLLRGIELTKDVSIDFEGCVEVEFHLFHNIIKITWSSSSCTVFRLNILQMSVDLEIGKGCRLCF